MSHGNNEKCDIFNKNIEKLNTSFKQFNHKYFFIEYDINQNFKINSKI